MAWNKISTTDFLNNFSSDNESSFCITEYQFIDGCPDTENAVNKNA
jgi:hypothetical protein